MTQRMKRCICTASIAVCDVALVAPMLPQVHARIVYNASASVALGWCCITPDFGPGSLRVGSTVLARLPDSVAAFGALCSYLP